MTNGDTAINLNFLSNVWCDVFRYLSFTATSYQVGAIRHASTNNEVVSKYKLLNSKDVVWRVIPSHQYNGHRTILATAFAVECIVKDLVWLKSFPGINRKTRKNRNLIR